MKSEQSILLSNNQPQPIIVPSSQFKSSSPINLDPNHNEQTNPSDNDQCSKREQSIRLIWKNISYHVSNAGLLTGKRSSKKCILTNHNGQISTGQMMAIIGPSGSGKTTLIECLAGRRARSSGSVWVDTATGGDSACKSVALSYMSHDDALLLNLTVLENLLFAQKLVSNEHVSARKTVNELINKLGLDQCAKVRVGNCSRGQQKRLSISLQLIHDPVVMLLDEPSSGLDSSNCLQTIHLLSQLAVRLEKAIILSIHQPTAFLLKYFHQLYVLSHDGQCIYNGPPQDMVDHVASTANVHCPTYHNPADFIVELALHCPTSQNHDPIQLLVQSAQQHIDPNEGAIPIEKIVQRQRSTRKNAAGLFSEWYMLFVRCLVLQYRDRTELVLRIMGTGAVIMLTWMMYYGSHLGQSVACFQTVIQNDPFRRVVHWISNETWTEEGVSRLIKDNTSLAHYTSHHDSQPESDLFNYGFVFFIQMFVTFISTMPIILTFPLEIQVIKREHWHGLYRLWVYFIAKNIANLILSIGLPVIFALSVYAITDQPTDELWRLYYFILSLTLIAVVGDGCGQWIGAMFVSSVNHATIFASISQLGLVMFSGLFVSTSTLPRAVQLLSYISHYRLCFESLIITLYGYGRCPAHYDMPIAFDRQNMLANWKMTRSHWNDLVNATEDGDSGLLDCMQDHSHEVLHLVDRVEKWWMDHHTHLQSSYHSSSVAMNSFHLSEEDLSFNLILLITYAIVYRILAFVILLFKTKFNQ